MKYHAEFFSDVKRNPYKGIFVAMEGIDGSGKTTQTEELKKYFEKKGKKVILAKSPRRDEGIIAQVSKQILEGKLDIPKAAFQHLFSADYIVQMEQIIVPALKKGGVVITDRFHPWSSVAYGIWENSKGKKYDVGLAKFILVAHGLFSKAYQMIAPDFTFFLNVPISIALERITGKKAKEMYEKKDVLEQIIIGYKWLIKEFPDEFKIIDGKKNVRDITTEIIDIIKK